MVRTVLAILAVIGLLASPVAAAAAEATCHEHDRSTVMEMPMSGTPSMAQANTAKADPCCDPTKSDAPSKHKTYDCMQACAAMCGVVAALPAVPAVFLLGAHHEPPLPALIASLKRHAPGRLERPPRSIA